MQIGTAHPQVDLEVKKQTTQFDWSRFRVAPRPGRLSRELGTEGPLGMQHALFEASLMRRGILRRVDMDVRRLRR